MVGRFAFQIDRNENSAKVDTRSAPLETVRTPFVKFELEEGDYNGIRTVVSRRLVKDNVVDQRCMR